MTLCIYAFQSKYVCSVKCCVNFMWKIDRHFIMKICTKTLNSCFREKKKGNSREVKDILTARPSTPILCMTSQHSAIRTTKNTWFCVTLQHSNMYDRWTCDVNSFDQLHTPLTSHSTRRPNKQFVWSQWLVPSQYTYDQTQARVMSHHSTNCLTSHCGNTRSDELKMHWWKSKVQ